MTKQQILQNADRDSQRTSECIIIHSSCQRRDNQDMFFSSEPDIEDIEYHLTWQEAENAAKELNLNVGYTAATEKILIQLEDIESLEEDEDFELSELVDRFSHEREGLDFIEFNAGKKLEPKSIVVTYRHHKYMNYAYDIVAIDFVEDTKFEDESDLIQDRDSTNANYWAHFEDMEELIHDFENQSYTPFDKIHSGVRLVEEFIEENL